MTDELQKIYNDAFSPTEETKQPDDLVKIASEAGISPDIITTPDNVRKAEKYVDNPEYNQYPGYCETFVEKVNNSGWKGTSAINAWQNQQDKAVQGTAGMKPGDTIYFSPTFMNEDGHVGIYMGGNKFISATENGVEEQDITDWMNNWGQSILGYIPKKGSVN